MSTSLLFAGLAVILLLAVVAWIGNNHTQDAKAGYEGSDMMGQFVIVVMSLSVAAIWFFFWIAGELIVKLIHRYFGL